MTWDFVHDGRQAFDCCFRAFCEPGRAVANLPRPELSESVTLDLAAGVLLALLDPGIGVAVVGSKDAQQLVRGICSMTGALASPIEEASFILVTDVAAESVPSRAFRGTPLQPERGATILYAGKWSRVDVTVRRLGHAGDVSVALPIPVIELDALSRANVDKPLGVDALVVDGLSLIGLPRGVTITRSEQAA